MMGVTGELPGRGAQWIWLGGVGEEGGIPEAVAQAKVWRYEVGIGLEGIPAWLGGGAGETRLKRYK